MARLKMNHTRRSFLANVSAALAASQFAPLAARAGETDRSKVRRVHLVFKTHLDIGYTDLEKNVVEAYLDGLIPHAMDLAEATRRENPARRFRWTTGSWLIHLALERGDRARRARLEKAISAGDILWHAMPFTLESEGATAPLMAQALAISKRLDARFGKTTIAGKMTDVPGHTRSIVPHLARQGMRYLHIGVNPASSPPEVPDFFRWRAPDGGELLVQYHKKYYGGEMPMPGGETVTAIMMTNDNRGPQTPEQIAKIYADLEAKYPNAEIVASSLDQIARDVIAIRERLPVVAAELGDTWIHGFGSDPVKMARMRRLSRLRDEWIAAGTWRPGSDEDFAFASALLQVAEHTWGLNSAFTGHWDVQTPAQLAKARRSIPAFVRTEESWREKRALVDQAVDGLPEPRQTEARRALESLRPARPDTGGWTALADPVAALDAGENRIALDPETGAVRGLRLGGRDWATAEHPLGLFVYQTFDAAHFERFRKRYSTIRAAWVENDFGKRGLERTDAREAQYLPRLKQAWIRRDENGLGLLVRQTVRNADGNPVPGCPGELWCEWSLPAEGARATLDFQWFDKQATRMPEALWLSFVPELGKKASMVVDKLGQTVDVREVVSKGGRELHGIDRFAESRDADGRFRVSSDEALLVAPGRRDLLVFDDRLPDPRGGQHWCLCNNTWGTNFVMWFGEDMRFRFAIDC